MKIIYENTNRVYLAHTFRGYMDNYYKMKCLIFEDKLILSLIINSIILLSAISYYIYLMINFIKFIYICIALTLLKFI